MDRENISRLMDGDMEPPVVQAWLKRSATDAEMRSVWDTYHLIGDALREHDLRHVDLVGRVAAQLAQEPTLLSPRKSRPEWLQPSRWLAVAAALGLITVTTWNLRQASQDPASEKLARNVPALSVSEPSQVAMRTPEMESYVVYHNQWTPVPGFQTVDFTTTVTDRTQ